MIDLDPGWYIFKSREKYMIGEVFANESGEKFCRLGRGPYDSYLHMMFDRYGYEQAEPLFPATIEKIKIVEKIIWHKENAVKQEKFGVLWKPNLRKISQLEEEAAEYRNLLIVMNETLTHGKS